MKKRLVYFIICVLFSSVTTFGQIGGNTIINEKPSVTHAFLYRAISFEKDSKADEVTFEINPKTQELHLTIKGSFTNGMVTVELYDSNETKQGNFTVGTQTNSEKEEMVTGSITKSLFEPVPGIWKVKIVPTNATGQLSIESNIVE